MPHYNVHVRRTEDITFAIEAENEEDAHERFLMDGEEVASSLNGTDVIEIEIIEEVEEPRGLGAVVECDYDGRHGMATWTGSGWTFYGESLVDHSADWGLFENVVIRTLGIGSLETQEV